jgi:hypothetical protein
VGKHRRLWLSIKGRAPGVSAGVFWGRLRTVTRSEEYELPEDWDVTIRWKNRAEANWKKDSFTDAMTESRDSGRGWDRAVLHYIERQIAKLPKREKPSRGKLSVRTKREIFERRSRAARKGWRTRRANARRRRAAARKGWKARRHRK